MSAKRLFCAIACLLFVFFMSNVKAEGYTLPINISAGPLPNPAGFISDTEYQDETLSVKMESRTVDGSVYHIAWIKIADPSQLRTALAGPYGTKKTAETSDIANENNAVVAISGNYFQFRSAGFEVRQGEILRKTPNTKLDLLVIDDASDFHLFKKSNKKELNAFLSDHTPVNALTFGPALVKDGEVQTIYNNYGFSPQDKAPRVAIGQTGPLQYVLVVVDGRQPGYSRGISIKTLAQFMGEIGCQQAFNLDGGGSATMVFNGKLYSNPSNDAERKISDIIYIASAVPESNWK